MYFAEVVASRRQSVTRLRLTSSNRSVENHIEENITRLAPVLLHRCTRGRVAGCWRASRGLGASHMIRKVHIWVHCTWRFIFVGRSPVGARRASWAHAVALSVAEPVLPIEEGLPQRAFGAESSISSPV